MDLPVNPPVLPMLAKRVGELPRATAGSSSRSGTASARWSFATATSSSSRAATRSRSTATSPSSSKPLKAQLPERCVLDGEIVIARGGGLDFEALQLRLHPAASRVKLLSKEIPASIVFFDLLCDGDAICAARRFASGARRSRRCSRSATPPLHLTPATTRSRDRRRLVHALRGRGARRRDGQAGRPASTSRTSA